MYFNICPECGAYLDPGEVCDCQGKEKAASGGNDTESGKGKISTNILAQTGLEVKQLYAVDDIIKVAQLPIIEERLRTMKELVDTRVQEAVSLVCTAETVQTVKAERTELRKQFDDLESRRKAVKSAIMEPYNCFEAVYKECVSDAFRAADATLKKKVDDVESEIKRNCENGLREYFDELCAAHHLDFLKYENAGIRVDMASAKQKTPRKLREQLVQFVARVSQDVDRIADMDDAEEIMVEYKRTLNAMEAIGTVMERHRRIEEEQAARQARAEVKAQEAEAVKKVEAAAPLILEPPIRMEKKEPILTCTFTVQATRKQLIKLKEFLKMEGIRYE